MLLLILGARPSVDGGSATTRGANAEHTGAHVRFNEPDRDSDQVGADFEEDGGSGAGRNSPFREELGMRRPDREDRIRMRHAHRQRGAGRRGAVRGRLRRAGDSRSASQLAAPLLDRGAGARVLRMRAIARENGLPIHLAEVQESARCPGRGRERHCNKDRQDACLHNHLS